MLTQRLSNNFYKRPLRLLIIIVLCYSANVNASTIDRWFEAYTDCTDAEICYQAARKLYIDYEGFDSLPVYAEAGLHYAYITNKNKYIVESLESLSLCSRVTEDLIKADSLAKLALHYTTNLRQTHGIYVTLAEVQQSMGKPDSCLQTLEHLLDIVGQDTAGLDWRIFYYARGVCYNDIGQITNTISDFIKVKELSSPGSGMYKLADYELARFYSSFDTYEKELEFFKKHSAKEHERGAYHNEMVAYINMLDCLKNLEDYENSVKIGHRAIRLKNEKEVNTHFGLVYHYIGDAFLQLNQLDSAQYYFEKGIAYSIENKSDAGLAHNLKVKAAFLADKGDYEAANLAAQKAISLNQDYDDELLELYAKINAALGNYKTAYQTMQTNWDSWHEKKSEKQTRMIAAMLLEDKTKLEREQERKDFEHQIQSQRQRNWLYLIGLFFVSALLLAYILMRNNKRLRQLNASLFQRNTALEQFAYITSHDLKEPIRSISSFAGLLDRKFKRNNADEEDLEYLTFIKNGAQKLFQLIESLKTFTDAAFTKFELEDVPINEVFESVQQNLSQFMEEKNGTLTLINEHNIDKVTFSTPMLTLALQHLVQNGFKYNESENPQVNVELKRKNNKIHFTVSDNGIGIEPEYFDKIFVPFKTLKNKTVNRSAGLGLSICKNILENHGSKIWVESDGVNGSNFTFAI